MTPAIEKHRVIEPNAPRFVDWMRNRGGLSSGNGAAARQILEELLALEQRLSPTGHERALVATALGDFDGARAHGRHRCEGVVRRPSGCRGGTLCGAPRCPRDQPW